MFFCCLFFCLCLDFVSLFPLPNCNAGEMYISAVLDCQDEVKEQVHFMDQLKSQFHTKYKAKMITSYSMMMRSQCTPQDDVKVQVNHTFSYNETQPLNEVMDKTKEFQNLLVNKCSGVSVSFIFIYNLTDIERPNNDLIKTIVANQNEDKETNRFFIIQSTEIPSSEYKLIGFIHFTLSFKELNIDEIFPKICDVNHPYTLQSCARSSHVTSSYQISTKIDETSHNAGSTHCNDVLGMNLLSLESFEEVIYMVQQLQNYTMVKETNDLKLHLGLYSLQRFSSNVLLWENYHPFHYLRPVQNSYDFCFYMNLSVITRNVLLNERNVNDFQSSIVPVKCDKPLQSSLVICEGKHDQAQQHILPIELFYNKSKGMFPIKTETVQHMLAFFIGSIRLYDLDIPYSFNECVFNDSSLDNQTTYSTLHGYLCNTKNENSTTDANTNHMYLLKKTVSFYTFKEVGLTHCRGNKSLDTSAEYVTEDQIQIADMEDRTRDQLKKTNLDSSCIDDIGKQNLQFSLQAFQCKTNKEEQFYKCLKDFNGGPCKDNSNLQNCEQFVCPEPFIKCPHSYCIFPSMLNNEVPDCPYGEDEYWKYDYLCDGTFDLVLSDTCLDSDSFDEFTKTLKLDNKNFYCENVCPLNYRCISSKLYLTHSADSRIKVKSVNIKLRLLIMFSLIFPGSQYFRNFPLTSVVAFHGPNCKINYFDDEFKYWKFQELLMLDLSYNNLSHSSNLKSLEKLEKLKYLNLSHNENLFIDTRFTFSKSLEIIDLSHTSIKSLKKDVFKWVINLRHLDLSYTLITEFEDMGLPKNSILDALYIQGLKIQQFEMDFFQGLTITSELVASHYIVCCPQILNPKIEDGKCHAPIDVISSCKHLVGDTLKRVVIWIVGFLTIVGNGIVLVYRIGWNREIFKKAYGLFITGLAISDFIMGVYLIIIAIVDAYYQDAYVLGDFKWRKGFLCNFCGFLSTLSSETSTFFICLITVDRFLCITYPFGEHRFTKTGKLLSFSFVWVIGFVLALIPIVLSDWEIYSSNGLCLALPLSLTQTKGWIFSFVVFVGLNFVLFLLIAFGQLTLFINLIKVKKSMPSISRNTQRRSEDLSVAKKLAFVAFSDFCCWFPIGILGFLSLNGHIFNREVYAWMAVFVLPINSALNPIIYTIPAMYSKCKSLSVFSSVTLESYL